MILLSLASPTLYPALPATRLLRSLGPPHPRTLRALGLYRSSSKNKLERKKPRGRWICRAELAQDAPFAAAIGACILNSLVFPIPSGGPDDEDESGGAIDSTDARLGVMGIISVIPYFNWMSWVFAWLDSGRQRYLVYSIVYLLPYLRTNLSLSPEESWLPIGSLLLCIIHVQLETSIRNGDLDDIQFLSEVRKLVLPLTRKKDKHSETQGFSKKGQNKEHVELPFARESRDELRDQGISGKAVDESQHNENSSMDADETKSD